MLGHKVHWAAPQDSCDFIEVMDVVFLVVLTAFDFGDKAVRLV